MTPMLVLCILLCAASAAPAEKENLPADVSEPQEEMMRMMVKEEEQELPEDLVPELIDAAESEQVEYPEARYSFCPFGWYLHSGFCYRVFTTSRNWTNALEDCGSWGAQLASVTSALQYDFLQQLSRSTNVHYPWLGGLYAQNQWIWSDGQRFSYNGWGYQYTPASYPCIYLRTDGGWYNSACSSSRQYICTKRAGC